MIYLGINETKNTYIPILSISEDLGISKIYLEQVFLLLKRANLVVSTKGSQGGYQLSTSQDKITAFDILKAIEQSLFQPTDKSITKSESGIEKSMENNLWKVLDKTIVDTLKNITLKKLVEDAINKDDNFMFFI